jgi:hypothetical protein
MNLHFLHQVTAYLNQCYENHWIGHHGPIPWLPKSPDLTPLDFFLWGIMKEISYRTKVHMKEEQLHWVMDVLRTYEYTSELFSGQ